MAAKVKPLTQQVSPDNREYTAKEEGRIQELSLNGLDLHSVGLELSQIFRNFARNISCRTIHENSFQYNIYLIHRFDPDQLDTHC